MAFFCLHPIAIDFSSIEKFLQFFSGLWFTISIFADAHFVEIYYLRWLKIFQQQPSVMNTGKKERGKSDI
jgi:hypothetical protein